MTEKLPDKKKNFYEILNLDRNCKSEEIKNSFIKMSKEYHPDKNKNNKYSHEKFLDIYEAYKTLKNPSKRAQYDNYLSLRPHTTYHSSNAYGNGKNYGFGSSSQSSSSAGYTGKLLLKFSLLPKAVVFATLVFISLCSAGVQFHFIRNDYESKKALLENKSLMAGLIINHAREQAEIYGKEEQMKRLREGVLGQFDAEEILDKYIKEANLFPEEK